MQAGSCGPHQTYFLPTVQKTNHFLLFLSPFSDSPMRSVVLSEVALGLACSVYRCPVFLSSVSEGIIASHQHVQHPRLAAQKPFLLEIAKY